MPRRTALLVHDDALAVTRPHDATSSRASESGDDDDGTASGTTWLLPWVLAFAGILITLALMR